LKSYRRNTEVKIKEETKPYLGFQKSRVGNKTCQKRFFVDGQMSTLALIAEVSTYSFDDAGSTKMVADIVTQMEAASYG